MTTAVGPGAANPANTAQAQNGLTQSQKDTLSDPKLTPEDKSRLTTQYILQNQQETMAFITNIMKKRNEIAMSVINNLR